MARDVWQLCWDRDTGLGSLMVTIYREQPRLLYMRERWVSGAGAGRWRRPLYHFWLHNQNIMLIPRSRGTSGYWTDGLWLCLQNFQSLTYRSAVSLVWGSSMWIIGDPTTSGCLPGRRGRLAPRHARWRVAYISRGLRKRPSEAWLQ